LIDLPQKAFEKRGKANRKTLVEEKEKIKGRKSNKRKKRIFEQRKRV
jgi:hypothetical protein